MKTYDQMFTQFKTGQISEEQWRDYSDKALDRVLEDTKDVFVRLKHR